MFLTSRLFSIGIHPCLHCGSLLKTEGLLCYPCRALVLSYMATNLESSRVTLFDVYAGFKWNPGASDALSSALVGLKGAKPSHDWQYWADQFLQRRLCQILPERPMVLVPAPSSTGQKDHAFYWAEALARGIDAEVLPCLKKLGPRHQRGASRAQRQRVRIDLVENSSRVSEIWSEALWVFVDDIVTTGSTAIAAYEALGSPPHFEVWALAQRSLSCGASTDLL